MKTIIAGSRHIEDYNSLLEAINESGFEITHVVSGGADGVDTMAVRWAKENEIPWTVFPAQWNKYRALGRVKQAGHVRNAQMAENGEALICLWDGSSSGTKNMIENATRKGLPVYVKTVQVPSKHRKKLDAEFLN